MRPLPNNIRYPEKCPPDAHSGLWYDKFCDKWTTIPQNRSDEKWKGFGDDGKLKWIKTVTGSCGNGARISELVFRQQKMVEKLEGKACIFTTQGRFVNGLGRSHPVENGFTWHPTLGTPYLPGSSVKGLVRAWVEQWLGDNAKDNPDQQTKPTVADISRIFGPRDNKNAAVGSVIFLDAIPVKPVTLEADVMTPHYGPYYSEGKAPGDWHDPTPIPFLAVADGSSFQFAVLPGRKAEAKDCEHVIRWVTDALQWLGAGAKTAVGYGRFLKDDDFIPPPPPESESTKLTKEIESDPTNLPNKREMLMNRIKKLPIEDRSKCAEALKKAYPRKAWKNAENKPWRTELEKWISSQP